MSLGILPLPSSSYTGVVSHPTLAFPSIPPSTSYTGLFSHPTFSYGIQPPFCYPVLPQPASSTTCQLAYHTLLRPTWKFLTFLPSSTPAYIPLIHPTTSYTGLFIPPTPSYHNLHSSSQPSYPVLPLPYSSSPRTLVACLLSNLIVPSPHLASSVLLWFEKVR